MSALSSASVPGVGAQPGSGSVTLARVIRSEWTKLWSLRSSRWSLLLAFVAQAGLGPLIAATAGHQPDSWNEQLDRTLAGWHLSQLAIAVLAVMFITGEYGTGQIRSTLLAVPKRLPVLVAKLLVFSSVTFVLMLIGSLIAFFAAPAAGGWPSLGLTSHDSLRLVFGNALFLTVIGAMCIGLGTAIRVTAGGIASFVLLFFVLTGIVHVLPTSTANAISPYLPENAGGAIVQAVTDPNSLSAWGGFALTCGYAAVAIALGAYLLLTRDA
jgi:MFS family permease